MTRRRKTFNADGGITEAVWGSQVEGFLSFYGWRWSHPPDNRPQDVRSGRAGRQRVGDAGFPDYVATRRLEGYGPELVIAELKTDRGRFRPGQEGWLADLGAFAEETMSRVRPEHRSRATVGVYVWRPRDRADVERILAGPAGVGVMVERPADLGVQAVRSLVE